MPFPPNGRIFLIGGLLIDNTYEHTLLFDTDLKQLEYFLDPSRVVYEFNEYQWMRKDQSIKVQVSFENLHNVNYIVYQNDLGKWIFNFITDKTYINDNNTELIIETDVMNTFMFDYTVNESLIEREHVDRWESVGVPDLNYVDEGLNYGDEYIKSFEKIYRGGGDNNIAWFLITTSEPLETGTPLKPDVMQGTPSPLYYYLTPLDRRDPSGTIYSYVDGGGNPLVTAQKFAQNNADNPNILSVSYIPYLPFLLTVSEVSLTVTLSPISGEWYSVIETSGNWFMRLDGASIDPFDDKIIGDFQRYESIIFPSLAINQPRNIAKESKLLTFPYMYNLLSDNQSTPMMVKNEYVGSNIEFVRSVQSLNINPKSKYYIDDYRGETNGKNYNMINATVNDLPLTSDAYKSYLAQNRATVATGIGVSVVGGLASLGIGLATGGVALPLLAGTALSSAGRIASELAKRKDLQTTPDSLKQSGNNIAHSFVDDSIDLRHMRFEISSQWKKILADYFALYGYKVNELKTPDLKSRYYYNYIKMHMANITGDIDMIDLQKIKNVFENGVTFWHYNNGDLDMFNDYQYDNVERKFT